jgi:hypothetical protein
MPHSNGTVESLWRPWARLRGLVPISPEGIRALRESVFSSRPLTTGAEVVTAVQRFAERQVRLRTRCKSRCPERGFTQYQFVIPFSDGERRMRESLGAILSGGELPFLNVLKRMGKESGGVLSFPREGSRSPSISQSVEIPQPCCADWTGWCSMLAAGSISARTRTSNPKRSEPCTPKSSGGC